MSSWTGWSKQITAAKPVWMGFCVPKSKREREGNAELIIFFFLRFNFDDCKTKKSERAI